MGSVDTWVGYWGRLRPDRAAVATNARVVTWKSLAERGGRLAAGLAAKRALRGSRIGALVKLPGPVSGALRREWRSHATPFVEMVGLSLQRSPYLEPDWPAPLLGTEDLAALGRQA